MKRYWVEVSIHLSGFTKDFKTLWEAKAYLNEVKAENDEVFKKIKGGFQIKGNDAGTLIITKGEN